MGLLGWGVYLALSQGDSTAGERDGSFIVVAYFCAVGDIIFSAGSGKLAILASQWHAQVKSPCHCVARIASSP